jgi:crotonobetainyl-CoA:carnitine CoA-transferase CaiB-like acyl-CoA transferase
VTRPLEGIKVLDFSEQGFVPSAAAALADFGADVVKIERHQGDAMRRIISSGLVASKDGYDFQFQLYNRNKRGIALDVEVPAGREVLERAVKWADVYITNQLPRVRRKLKTEPEDLMALNPKLVYARGHGQGQTGPDAEAGGFDGVSYWARGGVAHVLTQEGAERPVMQRPAMGDGPSGMFLAGGICAGLVHVLRTGKGVVVDVSLLGAAAWTLAPDLAYTSLTGQQMPMAAETARSPLVLQYKTSDDRWVSLMMIDEARYWKQACLALGLDDLIDRYPDPASRKAAWPEIRVRIDAVIKTLDAEQVKAALRAQDCIFSFFSTPMEVIADPAVVANGYLMSNPEKPEVLLAGAPVQFDNEPNVARRHGPEIGEHSREVLLEELGYTAAEVDQLASDQVIVSP